MEKSQQDSTWDDRWMGCIFNRAHYISRNIFPREEGLQSFYIPFLLRCYQLLRQARTRWGRCLLWLVADYVTPCSPKKWVAKPVILPFVTILLCLLGCYWGKEQKPLKKCKPRCSFCMSRVTHKIWKEMLFALRNPKMCFSNVRPICGF